MTFKKNPSPEFKNFGPIASPGERADLLLLAHLRKKWPALSRARLKELFLNGGIRIGGKRVRASDLIPEGTHGLEIETDALSELEAALEIYARPSEKGCFLPIAFEDENLLVLNKLSGIPSVPHEARETHTAVSAALAHCPALAGIGKGGLEPGLLHRLDTGTSGLLAFAKTQAEYERLKALWGRGDVRKTYRAICENRGPLPSPPSEYRLQLGHDPDSAKRMTVFQPGRKIRGKPLPTLTRITSARPGGKLVDFEIEIETGVMHQIRVTLAHLGFPILGDPIYRGADASRLWLHAWKLELPLASGEKISIEAKLPDDWPK